jgi:hypothetical protein
MKYKIGDKIRFIYYRGQIVNGTILKVNEHKHWFSKPNYTYLVQYNVLSMDRTQIVSVSSDTITEDQIVPKLD